MGFVLEGVEDTSVNVFITTVCDIMNASVTTGQVRITCAQLLGHYIKGTDTDFDDLLSYIIEGILVS